MNWPMADLTICLLMTSLACSGADPTRDDGDGENSTLALPPDLPLEAKSVACPSLFNEDGVFVYANGRSWVGHVSEGAWVREPEFERVIPTASGLVRLGSGVATVARMALDVPADVDLAGGGGPLVAWSSPADVRVLSGDSFVSMPPAEAPMAQGIVTLAGGTVVLLHHQQPIPGGGLLDAVSLLAPGADRWKHLNMPYTAGRTKHLGSAGGRAALFHSEDGDNNGLYLIAADGQIRHTRGLPEDLELPTVVAGPAGDLFVVGGERDGRAIADTWRLPAGELDWRAGPALSQARRCPGVLAEGQGLLVVGGTTSDRALVRGAERVQY